MYSAVTCMSLALIAEYILKGCTHWICNKSLGIKISKIMSCLPKQHQRIVEFSKDQGKNWIIKQSIILNIPPSGIRKCPSKWDSQTVSIYKNSTHVCIYPNGLMIHLSGRPTNGIVSIKKITFLLVVWLLQRESEWVCS